MSGQVRSNAGAVASELAMRATRAQVQALRTVQEFTVLLETRVKANASGRPGPRAITGNYRRSITSRVSFRGLITGTVGTNAPQGNRLEHGFYGVDALGRVYDQPPFPHFGPAARVTDSEFVAAIGRIVR